MTSFVSGEGTAAPDQDSGTTYPHRARDAAWVRQVQGGDQAAFAHLYEVWLDRVYDVVSRIVRNDELAAEVAQDTFLTAWRKLDTLRDPDVFGGWLLRIARNTALNRIEREKRSAPAEESSLTGIEAGRLATSHKPRGFGRRTGVFGWQDPADAAEELELSTLLWEAAGALGARDLEVLDLSLRMGLTPAEIGEVLDLNRNAANQLVHRVKGRLDTAIRARVLWRGGNPACGELAGILRSSGVESFDGEAIRLVDRHMAGCAACSDRQRRVIAGLWSETEAFGIGDVGAEPGRPSDLFSTLDVTSTAGSTRRELDAALIAHGVPVGDSAGRVTHPPDQADGDGAGDAGDEVEIGDEVELPDVPGAPPRSLRPGRPSGLFSTLGVAPVPTGVRRRATLGLQALGVPVTGADQRGAAQPSDGTAAPPSPAPTPPTPDPEHP